MPEQPFRPRREDSSRREDKSPPSLAATAITLTVGCAVFFGTCMGCIGPCLTRSSPERQQASKPDPDPPTATLAGVAKADPAATIEPPVQPEAVIGDKPQPPPPPPPDPANKPTPPAEPKTTPPGPSAGGKTPALDDAIAALSGADDVRVIDTRQRKIRTWELVDLWRAGNKAYGGRLRVGGNAIVRPSGSGLYVQLTGGDGRALVRAWVPRVDSGPLARTTSEEVVPDLVIEGEVKPTDGGTVLLEFARVPQAGDPDEYTEYVLALEPRVAKPKQGVVRAAAAADTEAASDPEPDVGTSGAGAGGTSGGRLGGRPIGNFRLPSTGGKTVSVRGYTRKDGTFVRPHMRSAPRSGGRR